MKATWIQTYTGRRILPLRFESCMYNITDVAHALSNLCRFVGHVKHFYSVAEHSCIVSDLASHDLKLAGLLHDAAEAYIGDIARPIKHAILDPRIEERILSEIFDIEKIPMEKHYLIKNIDNIMIYLEGKKLMGNMNHWNLNLQNIHILKMAKIYCWSPKEAEEQFMQRYLVLKENQ